VQSESLKNGFSLSIEQSIPAIFCIKIGKIIPATFDRAAKEDCQASQASFPQGNTAPPCRLEYSLGTTRGVAYFK
jgi:hypothetical protein